MDGKKNGFGIQKWKDGSKYKGNYVKDQAKGWGIFYHADGDVYKGEFAKDKIDGYGPGMKLINWYLGGISYVAGAILYIIRFPEKLFPGKFDYIGASHQIFHILVFLGALFHFFGSIDAYNYRFLNLKIERVE